MSNKKQTIQNIQSKIDELKDKISDKEYLELCNEMKTLNTQQESEKWYKVNYFELNVNVIEEEDEYSVQGDTVIAYKYKHCVLKKKDITNLPNVGCEIWIDFDKSTFKIDYDFDQVCAIKKNDCSVRASKFLFISAEPFTL
tara:strand:+ start:72 stop:494 length:423 start_codon:yes stop_codon:yes gene_type:complete